MVIYCPHRRSQHLLHAELQMIASEHELHESNESYLFKGHIRVIRKIRVQLNICSSTENSCHSRYSCSVKSKHFAFVFQSVRVAKIIENTEFKTCSFEIIIYLTSMGIIEF